MVLSCGGRKTGHIVCVNEYDVLDSGDPWFYVMCMVYWGRGRFRVNALVSCGVKIAALRCCYETITIVSEKFGVFYIIEFGIINVLYICFIAMSYRLVIKL